MDQTNRSSQLLEYKQLVTQSNIVYLSTWIASMIFEVVFFKISPPCKDYKKQKISTQKNDLIYADFEVCDFVLFKVANNLLPFRSSRNKINVKT